MSRRGTPLRSESATGLLLGALAMLSSSCAPDPPGEIRETVLAAEAPDLSGIASDAVDVAPPARPPERFGFGSSASDDRIALWDIDVGPDGEGLPFGSGDATQGERVYLRECVACHGFSGVEGPNDRLVDEREWGQWPSSRAPNHYWPYATTLYDYVRRSMPQLTPGSLSADDTYAVIAFILYRGGIIDQDEVMDAESLPAVEMPSRERFVADDRTGGHVIR